MRIRIEALDLRPAASPCFVSPNPRQHPPAYPGRVVAVARQLSLQHTVFGDRAVQQARDAGNDQHGRSDPRSERDAARQDDSESGEVAWVSDEGVWPGR